MKLIITTTTLVLLSALVTCGCGGATEAPSSSQGAPATGPAPAPSPREPSASSTPPHPGPVVPAPPVQKPAAQSCAQLAVDKKPAGQFELDEIRGGYGLVPVDVHVTERVDEIASAPGEHVRTLSIALGETPHECAYAESVSSAQQMNELRLVLRRGSTTAVPAAFDPGRYDAVSGVALALEAEAGERCVPEGDPRSSGGGGGTAVAGGNATGTVIITARTATTIEGSFDVTSTDGRLKGTFKSPICAPIPSGGAAKAVCCKGS